MTHPRTLSADAVRQMTLSTDPWLSCDDCFDLLDTVVETVLTGAGRMSEEFRVHLTGCSVCRDEATSLATLAGPDYGVEPPRAASLLTAAVTGGEELRPADG